MNFSKIRRRIRQPRTLCDKLKVIEEIESNPSEKKTHIAKRLGLAPSTLNTIYARKNKIRKQIEKYGESSAIRKSSKESNYSDLEEILYAWYRESLVENNPVNVMALTSKAKDIAASLGITNFSASSGWICRFKERHGIVKKLVKKQSPVESLDIKVLEVNDKLPEVPSGVSTTDISIKKQSLNDKYSYQGLPTMVNFHMSDNYSSDIAKNYSSDESSSGLKLDVNDKSPEEEMPSASSSVSTIEILSNWFKNLPTLIGDTDIKDIYNLHEIGIFYNCLPDSVPILKNETCEDGRFSRDRLSILLCVNGDGSDKVLPIVIGKSLKPRCFKHLKTLPTTYYPHKKVWFTKDVFSWFLMNFDTVIGNQNRKILLFLEDCDLHHTDVSLKNIKLIFFPLSYSTMVQPMQGTIKCFKANYRKQLLIKTLSSNNIKTDQPPPKINVLQALHLIVAAWGKVSSSTITNSYIRSFPCIDEADVEEEEDISDFEEWKQIRTPPGVDFNSYINVDNSLFTSGIESLELPINMCTVKLDSDKVEGNEIKYELSAFSAASEAFKTLKTFLYSHNLTENDKTHILNIENLLNSFNTTCE